MKIGRLVCVFFLSMILAGCLDPQEDYSDDILGTWYAVEYETQYVEFFADGTVADHYNNHIFYGQYLVDNENALLWVNFGDDIISLQISQTDDGLVLLDSNGTFVRQEDLLGARENKIQNKNNSY